MGPSATIQHVRHLAVQGLPAKQAVAAMVDALDALIPTRTKIFFWVGEDLSPRDFYEREPLVDALDAYLSQAALLAQDPEEPSFDKLANSPVEFGGWRRFTRMPRWERSVLKNEVFGAYGIGNNLDFTIRDAGRPIGMLAIAREPGSRAYTRAEIDTVLALRGHFVHAMTAGQNLSAVCCGERPEGDPAIAVIAPDGAVCQASPGAALLLHQLSAPQASLRVSVRQAAPAVRAAIGRLHAIHHGQPAPPPRCDCATPWGTIRIIAHALCPGGEAVVSLQKLVPRTLRRIKQSAKLDLSPREREVAVAMCGTGEGDAIARSLGLAPASYREYARRIYNRLGVEGRIGVKDLLDS